MFMNADRTKNLMLYGLTILLSLFSLAAVAQPASFPSEWNYWMSDPDENGTSNDYRDVQAIYYQVDSEYIYLRLQNQCDCGWGANDHGRYKWFIDVLGGDAYLQGGTFRDYEFMLMLEDHINNDEDPLTHDHNKAEHDFLGELYLLDDLGNVGVDVRWGSGSQPHPYMINTPVGAPSPSPYWRGERGEGVGGFGGSQEVFGADIGFKMEGQFVDMYISTAVLDNPDEVCMYWATDQENQNLDQAPHQDRPTTDLCFDIPLLGTITINKHIEPDGDANASFAFGGDLGVFSLDIVNGADASTTFTDQAPGTYDVFENLASLPDGYELGSIVCDDPSLDSAVDLASGTAMIELAAGEDVTCTFTNVETPVESGTIVIVKHSLPHNPQSFGFTSDVPGYEAFALSDTGDAHTLIMTDVAPGPYTVTEGDMPDNWHPDGLICVDPDQGSSPLTLTETQTASIDLDEGEVVTCTFRNGLDAVITIIKRTDPDGSLDEFGFSGSFGAFQLQDDEEMVFDGLDMDDQVEYTVTESSLPAGWLLQQISCQGPGAGTLIDLSAGSVTMVIDHGDDITCTFHNSAPGTLIIHKEIIPDTDTSTFSFTDGFEVFNASPGSPHVATGLAPSVIEVTELGAVGPWVLEDAYCNDPDGGSTIDLVNARVFADVDAAETVECVFVNRYAGIPIPTLSYWMMLLLASLLMVMAWLALRRGGQQLKAGNISEL